MLGQLAKGQWPSNLLRLLGLRFVCRLLLLLELFGPWRRNAIHTGVGDGLAEVLAEVPGNGDERAAQRGRAVKHFLRFVSIGFAECHDGSAEMREGILQG